MIKTGILLITLLPQISFALDFYQREEWCESIDKTSPYAIKSSKVFDIIASNLQKEKNDAISDLKKDLWEKIDKLAKEENIDSFYFKSINLENPTDRSAPSRFAARLKASVTLYPATQCNVQRRVSWDQIKVSSQESLLASGTVTREHVFNINISAETNKSNHASPLLVDPVITESTFYGLSLGMTKEAVLDHVQGFDLEIQISPISVIHIIGRNHAFYFKNNLLVGYQYAYNLLPIVFANQLAMTQTWPQFQFDNQNILIDDDLSASAKSAIKKLTNNNAQIETVKNAITEEIKTKLLSFSLGETNTFIPMVNNTRCVDFNAPLEAQLTSLKHHYRLKFNEQDKNVSYLNDCQQLLTFQGQYLKKVKLMQLTELTNYQLSPLKKLLNQQEAWKFGAIKQGMPESQVIDKLKVSDPFIFEQQLEISNDKWYGTLQFGEKGVVSGKLDYFGS